MTAESSAIRPTSCKQVNGTQTATSTSSSASAARGRRAAVYSSASLTVLFIFQCAAIIGRRAMRSPLLPVLLFRQDCYAGQLLAFDVLERGTAAGRDVAHPALEAELVDGGYRVSSAHDARRAALGDGPGHALRAFREVVDLEDAHRTVPEDGARARDVPLEERHGLRPYIQAHLARRDAVDRDRLGLGALLHSFGNDDIDRQDQPVAGFFHETLRLLQVVVLDERVTDLVAEGLEEREAHRATDEQRIRGFQQALYNGELVRDLRPPENGDERALGMFEYLVEVVDLLLHQEPRCRGQPLGHPDGRGVRPVGRAEGVVYVEVGEGRELIREPRIVLGLAWIEPGVLEQHEAPAVPIVEGLFHVGADGGVELLYGPAEQLM